MTDVFIPRIYSGAKGRTLPFRLLVPPRYDKTKQYPALLFLHGSGERGNDNVAQLVHVASVFAKLKFQAAHPCFVIVPQCPEGEGWSEFRRNKKYSARPSAPMQLALKCLDDLVSEFNLDEDRLYIGGLSMGGFGVWDCLTRFPERFAAGIVCCGGGHPEKVTVAMARVPVWVFHSDDDGAVPVELDRKMVAALKKKGGRPKYTEYEGIGHNCWDAAFAEPELMPWLFGQRRGRKGKV